MAWGQNVWGLPLAKLRQRPSLGEKLYCEVPKILHTCYSSLFPARVLKESFLDPHSESLVGFLEERSQHLGTLWGCGFRFLYCLSSYWVSSNLSKSPLTCSYHFITSYNFCSEQSGLCFCISAPSFFKHLISLASMTLHSPRLTLTCFSVCIFFLMRQSTFWHSFNFCACQDSILCPLLSLHVDFEWVYLIWRVENFNLKLHPRLSSTQQI